MKKILVAAFAALAAFQLRADFEEEAFGFDRFYVGLAETVVFPQGGGRMSDHTGAAFRLGFYLTEMWAIEGEGAWVSDRAGLSLKALWHWWGYERLDPFFTLGAKGWVNDGQVGPAGGVGAFYHMTESVSLRIDADSTLGLDSDVEMVYSLAAGVQLSF